MELWQCVKKRFEIGDALGMADMFDSWSLEESKVHVWRTYGFFGILEFF